MNSKYAWQTEKTRPQPVIVETQYEWEERYKPFESRIRGFTNTSKDPGYIRAFRFGWTPDGVVELTIKGSPSAPKWYGSNGVPDGPGFVCLRGIPNNYPFQNDHCL